MTLATWLRDRSGRTPDPLAGWGSSWSWDWGWEPTPAAG
jgi:hypothetical protein